jgi:membrane protease YdiL (CAAX protease family)
MSDDVDNNTRIPLDVVANGVFISILSFTAYNLLTLINDVIGPFFPSVIGIVVLFSGYVYTSRHLATSLLFSRHAVREASKITTLIFCVLPPLVLMLVMYLWFSPKYPHSARFSGGFYLMLGHLVFGVIVEEIFFRGILLPFLLQQMAVWKALVIQAALFSVAHIFIPSKSGEFSLLLFFIVGISLGLLFMRTRSLWAVIFAHFIWNATAVALNAYPPVSISGGTFTTISVDWIVTASCFAWAVLAAILMIKKMPSIMSMRKNLSKPIG